MPAMYIIIRHGTDSATCDCTVLVVPGTLFIIDVFTGLGMNPVIHIGHHWTPMQCWSVGGVCAHNVGKLSTSREFLMSVSCSTRETY